MTPSAALTAVLLVLVASFGVSLCEAKPYHVYVRRSAAMSPNVTQAMKMASVDHDEQSSAGSVFLFDASSADAIREEIEKMYEQNDESVPGEGQEEREARHAARRSDGQVQIIINEVLSVKKSAAANSWGLDRIDQRSLPLNGVYNRPNTGDGVTAWVVDTGLDPNHNEFITATGVYRASNDFAAYNPAYDCDGHGTHVGGTIGGATFGVAPGVRLRGIKVLNCAGAGTTYTVSQGLLYVLAHLTGKDVINLSLGYSGRDAAVEAVLVDLMAAGAYVVAAAGNDNGNACMHFPSAQIGVASVAATTNSDARASYSNYGSCVTFFAPGSNIMSANMGGGSVSMSGTSMASPHVAGFAALVLQNSTAPLSIEEVTFSIASRATANIVTNPVGSPNQLLYVLAATAQPEAPSSSTSRPPSSTPSTSRPPRNTTRPHGNSATSAVASVMLVSAMLIATMVL